MEPDRGSEHEHAGVPVVATLLQVAFGSGSVGLFDEGLDWQGVGARACGLDIAVAGFGLVGGDAQDDDAAGGGLGDGLVHGRGEGGGLGHSLVGGGDDQDGVLPAFHGRQGRQREGRGGVAALGFEQGAAQFNAGFAQLFGRQKPVLFASDDERGADLDVRVAQLGQALRGLLEQTVVAGQAQELFGKTSARQGPQAGARAAAQDDGGDVDHGLAGRAWWPEWPEVAWSGALSSSIRLSISVRRASYSACLRCKKRPVSATFSKMPCGVST